MTAFANPQAAVVLDETPALGKYYLEALNLIERLHRQLLDVIKDELDRRDEREINSVQALLLFNVGDQELTAGELRTRAIDVCSDYRRAGRRLLGAEELLAQRERARDESGAEQGFYVPAPHMQFIYYLLKKVDKLELKPSHGEYLTELWSRDSYRASREIARFWQVPADAELLERAAEHGEWAAVRAQLPRLRRAMRRVARRTVVDAFTALGGRLRRLRAPSALVVALPGPDGAGPSSGSRRLTP